MFRTEWITLRDRCEPMALHSKIIFCFEDHHAYVFQNTEKKLWIHAYPQSKSEVQIYVYPDTNYILRAAFEIYIG